jgi:hypothetical protein
VITRGSRSYGVVLPHFGPHAHDFRTRFAEFEDCVEMVGAEVLPQLRRA